jgi:hypothetical protein
MLRLGPQHPSWGCVLSYGPVCHCRLMVGQLLCKQFCAGSIPVSGSMWMLGSTRHEFLCCCVGAAPHIVALE